MEQVPGGWSFSVGKETIVGKLSLFALVPIPVLWGTARNGATRGVSYCALCDGNFFRSGCRRGWRRKLRAGRGAVSIQDRQQAVSDPPAEGFRAAKVYQDKIHAASDKIELVLDTVGTGLMGEDSLQGLHLKNVKTGEEKHSFLWMECSSCGL